MKISVLSLAQRDLKEIHLYLTEYGIEPPRKFRDSFAKFCTLVVDMPYMYAAYEHNSNYRKAVILYDYLVFYQVDEGKSEVMIYRILHSKRDAGALLNNS